MNEENFKIYPNPKIDDKTTIFYSYFVLFIFCLIHAPKAFNFFFLYFFMK